MNSPSFALPLLAASLLCAGAARATTLDTFSFSQDGYLDPNVPGQQGVLTGTFTGTVEASGLIGLGDLTSIRDQFSIGNGTAFGYGPATFFSFDTNGGASTLDLETPIGLGGTACVGAVAAFGFGQCATAGLPGPINGFVDGASTANLQTVTLVSSVVIPLPAPQPLPIPHPVPAPQPQPHPVAVPEPGMPAILGLALLVLGFVRGLGRSVL